MHGQGFADRQSAGSPTEDTAGLAVFPDAGATDRGAFAEQAQGFVARFDAEVLVDAVATEKLDRLTVVVSPRLRQRARQAEIAAADFDARLGSDGAVVGCSLRGEGQWNGKTLGPLETGQHAAVVIVLHHRFAQRWAQTVKHSGGQAETLHGQ